MDIFILNIAINSLFTFFTVSLLILAFLWLTRIKSPRLKACCLCLPALKLGYDLCFGYDFSHWALAQSLNPLECPEGTRQFSLSAGLDFPKMCHIGFSLYSGETFSLADCFALWIGSTWTFWLAKGWIALTFISLSRWIFSFWQSRQHLNRLYSSAKIYSRPILNPKLNVKIHQHHAYCYLSDEISSPCIIGLWHPVILFPSKLSSTLTQQEFEAIIAHELAHLTYCDVGVKVILSLFKAFFWWIPMKWLNAKIELYQEQACDQSILQHGIRFTAMLEAIYKTSHHILLENQLAMNFTSRLSATKRLKYLLDPPQEDHEVLTWTKGIVIAFLTIALLTGKLWNF